MHECSDYHCSNYKDGHCMLCSISINDDHECDNFFFYKDSYEYGIAYYKAMRDVNKNKIFKKKSHGKKITYRGYVFFTEEDDRYGDDITVTEERTGICGSFSAIKSNFEIFEERLKGVRDVMSLEG